MVILGIMGLIVTLVSFLVVIFIGKSLDVAFGGGIFTSFLSFVFVDVSESSFQTTVTQWLESFSDFGGWVGMSLFGLTVDGGLISILNLGFCPDFENSLMLGGRVVISSVVGAVIFCKKYFFSCCKTHT